jgi:hypothetical protein
MRLPGWLAVIAFAVALAFGAVRCGKDVELGVDPRSDAAAADGGDAAAGN